jgi:hypothetical protein
MRPTRVGRFLLGLGVGVGVAAGVGLIVGFEPARLPPALLNLAAYKLTFAAALGLLVAGAAVVRYGRREEDHERAARDRAAQLGEGSAPAQPIDVRRDAERAREPRT